MAGRRFCSEVQSPLKRGSEKEGTIPYHPLQWPRYFSEGKDAILREGALERAREEDLKKYLRGGIWMNQISP